MELTHLRALGAHIAALEDVELDARAPNDELRRRLAERAGQPRARTHRMTRFPLHARALAVGAVLGLGVGLGASSGFFADDPLLFTVGVGAAERSGIVRAWESASAKESLPIRFSDGTAVTLQPDARARVVKVTDVGADLVIESGRASFDVVHGAEAEWRVRTGPFVIEVTGTRFEVGWDPAKDDFVLELFEGSVSVSGCTFGSGHAVSAGQRVRASCAEGRLEVAAAGSPRGDASPTSATSVARDRVTVPEPALAAESASLGRAREPGVLGAAALPAHAPGGAANASAPDGGAESWQELARKGRYREAYDLASKASFEAECERARADELSLLADAARHSGRGDHARRAQEAARRRFPGSSSAGRAAFDFGRAAFEAGDMAGAARWLETHLAEQPGGGLAAAARGRLIEAYVRVGDGPRAQATARAYLRAHPGGAHADEARRILDRVATGSRE